MDTIQILIRADDPADVTSSTTKLASRSSEELDLDEYECATEKPEWWRSKCKLVLNMILISVSSMLIQMAFMFHANPGQMFNFYEPNQIESSAAAQVMIANDARTDLTNLIQLPSESNKPTDWILLLTNLFCKLLDCLIIPFLLIDKLGAKLTIIISISSYLVYFLLLFIKPLKSALYIGVFANELFGNSFLVGSLVYVSDMEGWYMKLVGYKIPMHPFYLAIFNASFMWIPCVKIALVKVKGTGVIFGEDFHIVSLTAICVIISIVFAACSQYSGVKEVDKGKQQHQKRSYEIKSSNSKAIWLMTPLILFLGMLQAFGFKLFTLISSSSLLEADKAVLVYGLAAVSGNLLTGLIGTRLSERCMVFVSMLICYLDLGLLYYLKSDLLADFNLLLIFSACLGVCCSVLESTLIVFHNSRTNNALTFCRLIFIKAAGVLLATFVYLSLELSIFVLLGILTLGFICFCIFSLLHSC